MPKPVTATPAVGRRPSRLFIIARIRVMPTKNDIRRYGWVADLPDHRDFLYAAPQSVVTSLPAKVDLTKQCPPVYNQGRIGSCTANAIAGAVQFVRRKEAKKPDFIPSRLFIYWNERNIEHTVPLDNGAQLRDGIKVVNKLGACPETDWPYDDTPADEQTHLWPTGAKATVKPTKACFDDAKNFQSIGYQRVARTLAQMKGCLASGYPFVFGFAVYESFQSLAVAKSGVLNMPGPSEQMIGGHAVLAVGYDEASQRFIVRNSWGASWGKKGYFTIPYAYLLDGNLADDFWTIRVVE
jgi:C1A family cysteine protease